MKSFAKLLTGAAGILALVASTPSAQALTTLRISANGGASWATIRDSAINPDGSVSFDGSIGASGWSISALGDSALGTAAEPFLSLAGATVTSTKAGTLLIEFTQSGYGPFPSGNSFTTTLNSHNEGSGRTTIWTYAGLDDLNFERTVLLGSAFQNTASDDADTVISTPGLSGYVYPDQYSLTIRMSVYHSAAGSSTFDVTLLDPPTVPDGGSTVSLLGAAILMLGGLTVLLRRFRRA